MVRAQRHGRDYALKAFVPGTAENDATREAAILSELNHPGIPRFVELFRHDDVDYLVQEFIKGYPLSSYILKGKRFSEREVEGILFRVLQIIEYLHEPERGRPPIIHRDLRLSNIFWSRNRVHLIDFGFARTCERDGKDGIEQDGRVCLTMDRCRPGRRTYALLREEASPRSDLFGAGVVGLDLFTNWIEDEIPLKTPWQDIFPGGDSLRGFLEQLLIPENQFPSARDALRYLEKVGFPTLREPSSGLGE